MGLKWSVKTALQISLFFLTALTIPSTAFSKNNELMEEELLKIAGKESLSTTFPHGQLPNQGERVRSGANDEILPRPQILLSDERALIYICRDTFLLEPTINAVMTVRTPQVDLGIATKTSFADLYIACLNDLLGTLLIQMSLAGVNFSIYRSDTGISFTIEGDSGTALKLFQEAIQQITTAAFDEDGFKKNKTALLHDYQDAASASTADQAEAILKSALYKRYATPKAIACALKKISWESFAAYTESIFKKTYTEGLFYGDINENAIRELLKEFLAKFHQQGLSKKEKQKQEVLVFHESRGPFYLEMESKTGGSTALLAIAHGDYSFDKRAAQQILMESILKPFFMVLRTEKKRDCLIDCYAYEVEKQLFSIFLAQSSSYDPRDLLARLELFIENCLDQPLKLSLSGTEFENLKCAQIAALRHSAKNSQEMAALLYSLAFAYGGNFDWIQKRIDSLNHISCSDLQKIQKVLFGHENHHRLAILIKGKPQPHQPCSFIRLNSLAELRKLSIYKTTNWELQ